MNWFNLYLIFVALWYSDLFGLDLNLTANRVTGKSYITYYAINIPDLGIMILVIIHEGSNRPFFLSAECFCWNIYGRRGLLLST